MNTKQILKIRCVYKDILDKIDLRKYVLAEKIISITNHQKDRILTLYHLTTDLKVFKARHYRTIRTRLIQKMGDFSTIFLIINHIVKTSVRL